MKKTFMELIAIESGEFCPDTGTWYANLKKEFDRSSFDFIKEFKQGDEFPEFKGSPTKWSSHFDVSSHFANTLR